MIGGVILKKIEMTGIQENKNLLNILTPIRRNRIQEQQGKNWRHICKDLYNNKVSSKCKNRLVVKDNQYT